MLPYYGPAILLISCLLIYFAYKKYEAKDFNWALVCILLVALLLRVFVSSDAFLHVWDERYHALVAKHFIEHPLLPTLYEHPLLAFDQNNFTSNHIWLSKPPVPLWFTSLSLYLWGNHEFAIRVPSIIFSLLSIWLTYKIALLLFRDPKIALLASFLHAINGMLLELVGARLSSDLVETIFLFFSELSIYYLLLGYKNSFKTSWLLCCGITTGIAFLCKWTPALLPIPILFLLLLHKENKIQWTTLVLLLLSIAAPISLWAGYCYLHFPAETKLMLQALIQPSYEVIQEHQGSLFYYFNYIRIIFGEIIYLPLALALYLSLKRDRNQELGFLCLWFLIPLLLFSLAATKRATYILVAAPAIFIIFAYCFNQLSQYAIRPKLLWLKNLILFLLIAMPIRYCIERMKPLEKNYIQPQWVSDLKHWEGRNNKKAVLFGYNAPIEAMFYTEATVYQEIPPAAMLNSLSEQGYDIFINTNEQSYRQANLGLAKGTKIMFTALSQTN